MKILDANMMVTSHNSSEQMNFMLKEETQDSFAGKTAGLSNNRFIGTGFLPSMVVDRVSISQNTQKEYQSGYSGEISSRSTVKTAQGDTAVFEQRQLLETIVGAVIDRDVVVQQIQQGKNIGIDTGLTTPKISSRAGTDSSQLADEKIISLKQTDIHFEAEQMTFASQGEVVTEDGKIIEFSLDLSLDRAFLSKTEQETLVHTWKEQVILTDPLVISLDGRLPLLSDTSFEFDLDNDGEKEKVSFVSSGSGFLAFDQNNDQKINNGSELFGPGTGNGFKELAVWDGDKNGWIDENDDVFSQLSVWTRDENGEDRLISLKDAGIGAIYLESAATGFDMTGPDNFLKGRLKSSGVFLFENGNVGSIQQIDLATRPIESDTIKTELNTVVNNPVPGVLPMVLTPGFDPGSLEGQQNPLETLMEQINALKEEMNQLLGNRSPSKGFSQGLTRDFHRFSGVSGEQNGFAPSTYQLYEMIHPDTFILLSGSGISLGKDKYA
jgi:hypothetical protein